MGWQLGSGPFQQTLFRGTCSPPIFHFQLPSCKPTLSASRSGCSKIFDTVNFNFYDLLHQIIHAHYWHLVVSLKTAPLIINTNWLTSSRSTWTENFKNRADPIPRCRVKNPSGRINTIHAESRSGISCSGQKLGHDSSKLHQLHAK